MGRWDGWRQMMQRNGFQRKWRKSYMMYYGRHWKTDSSLTDSEIQRVGDQGELSAITTNNYRNLLKHVLILTTNQVPAFDVRAVNGDPDSLTQARLGEQILDAYMKDKKLKKFFKAGAEMALIFGKGFTHIQWDPSLGEPYQVQDYEDEGGDTKQRLLYEGDVRVTNPSVFDVLVDQSLEDWEQAEWVCVREWRNKFNLAVRYPEHAEEIKSAETKEILDSMRAYMMQALADTSDIPLYYFYHKRTDAMPNGRFLLTCGDGGIVLYDGPIPYRRLPVFRITPGEIYGTTEGYTDGFDLIGQQEAENIITSTMLSNLVAFGVQNVLVPDGCNLGRVELSKALTALKYNPAGGKPEPLQLCAMPQGAMDLLKLIKGNQETLSGINSVVRGDPSALGKNASGVALNLIQSMAIQFASGFQESYGEMMEESATFILDLLKDFAQTKRMIALAGKNNRSAMKAFSNKDIQLIDRVVVDLGNPARNTSAGKMAMADSFLEKGIIKTPQDYVQVFETGTLEPVLEGPEAQMSLINQENEMLMEVPPQPAPIDPATGQPQIDPVTGMPMTVIPPVKAVTGDAHILHCQKHLGLLNNPEVRNNAEQTASVLAHIQEHKQLYQTQDQFFTMLSGEPPPPPPPPPPGMLPPPNHAPAPPGGPGHQPPGHHPAPPPGPMPPQAAPPGAV
jgi:hypothetical protein